MTPNRMSHTTPSVEYLKHTLVRQAARAITDYGMIAEGDTVMVCLSGGKDSYTLLDVLLHLQARAPIDFRLVAVNLDQQQPGFPKHVLPAYLRRLGVEYRILEANTYRVVTEKTREGKTMCSLCSRLRRGILYNAAAELGATKIALGHHRDDILETFFMNMFFGARLKGMPPKLRSDDGRHVVIRPLAYCAERDIQAYADARGFPIIPCNLCGSQENLQRKVVGEMLQQWERTHPGRLNNILRALAHVSPSHLMDPALYDFKSLTQDTPESDTALDHENDSDKEFLVGLQAMQMLP